MLQPVSDGSIRLSKPEPRADEIRPFNDGWNYRLLKIDCGKPACLRCRGGPSHGPYWYAERKKPGDYSAYPKTQTMYIGKRLRAVEVVQAERDVRRRVKRRRR